MIPSPVLRVDRLGLELGSITPQAEIFGLSASNPSDQTRSGEGFTQTRWTQVLLAEKDQSPAAREALDYLCSRYWPSASVAVYRLRTRYRELILEEVLATVSDTELVKAEFLDLFGSEGS